MPPSAPKRPPEQRRSTHSFGAPPPRAAPPRGPPPQMPQMPLSRRASEAPPPRGPFPPGAEPRGVLRKVDSACEAKGQRLQNRGYGPLVGPEQGRGIQRVSLSAMLRDGSPGGKAVVAPKIARPPTLATKAAPPKEAPEAPGARIHRHAPVTADALPPEWTQHWDEEVGSHYFFNAATGEVTWVKPTA